MSRIFTLSQLKPIRRKLRQQSTRAETALWNYLQARRFFGHKFRRQHSIGRYVADFFCAELLLVIEVDGDSHLDPDHIEYDRRRQAWIEAQGIRVARFTDGQVLEETQEVLKQLHKITESLSSSHPSSSRRAQPI